MTVRCRLPTCVLPAYWKRHQLSRRDIDTIVSYVPTKLVWMSAVLCGVPCPWYSLRSSSASPTDATYSGKSQAVDCMLQKLSILPSVAHKLDVDSIESFEHVPPIPKYVLPSEEIVHLSRGLASQLTPRVLLGPSEPLGIIPLVYMYHGQWWVPVGIEGDAICCNALVREADYVHSGRGYTHAPIVGVYQETVYCLTDELVLFRS
jgi:hypothetical protein